MESIALLFAPEGILLITAMTVLFLDLMLKKDLIPYQSEILLLIGSVMSTVIIILSFGKRNLVEFRSIYLNDSFSEVMKLLLLFSLLLILWLSWGREQGNFYGLVAMATLGGMAVASSADLIALFMGLQLIFLSCFTLLSLRNLSFSWKYFIYGGVSSAFFLYGLSFLYGFTGSTDLEGIREGLNTLFSNGQDLFIFLGLVLILVGLGFHMAMVPFHLWLYDLYQKFSLPVISFFTLIPKIAGFAIVLRILLTEFDILFHRSEWAPIFSYLFFTLAAVTIFVGHWQALRQKDIKGILAYSSIAHVGLLLCSLLGSFTFPSFIFYLVAFILMHMGLFAILWIVTKEDSVDCLVGLHQRSPFLAFSLLIFILSLAGIPLTAGFFGKFYLLTGMVANLQYGVLFIVGVSTIISFAYYFHLIQKMYFQRPKSEILLLVPYPIVLVIVISLIGSIGLGIFPHILLDPIFQTMG